MTFANEVAVVTGGGFGIGKEVARALIAKGIRVANNGRDAGKLHDAAVARIWRKNA